MTADSPAAGRLLAIARKPGRSPERELLDRAEIDRVTGIEGDLLGKIRNRQVTILSREAWEATCAELGVELDWTTRRANLLVEGLDLDTTPGGRLAIGGVVLEVTGESLPCAKMEARQPGLRAALKTDARGGLICKVVQPGTIAVGDAVTAEAPATA
ncbi:MAG: MOSC domain-containing protein [Azospirillaceae bacterium]